MEKTATQLKRIANRNNPLAGHTGGKTEGQYPLCDVNEPSSSVSDKESYVVRIVQHAAENTFLPDLQETENDRFVATRPEQKFALKKKSGKRVTFTNEQKEIMIEFYNGQAESGIRATPEGVIDAMQTRGIQP